MLKKYNTYQLFFIGLIAALFVMYPDITWLPFDLKKLDGTGETSYVSFFLLRYTFLVALVVVLIKTNLEQIKTSSFKKRFAYNLIISLVAYAIYGGICFLMYSKVRHYGSLVLFQFFIVALLSTLTGYIVTLYNAQRKSEQEIADLRVKNLQSRYDALTNQINPHFFFNSLNGLTSLIRKKSTEETLTYVSKLSDVFRYILQSDKKGLVTLGEELGFVDAFRYMMEIRFANKLEYHIDIDQNALSQKIPVLSILPLLDNVVVHNRIDSDHKMTIRIFINEHNELVVSNPVYPKLSLPETNGTGIKNLESRFLLLMDRQIRIAHKDHEFNVYLPLN